MKSEIKMMVSISDEGGKKEESQGRRRREGQPTAMKKSVIREKTLGENLPLFKLRIGVKC